MQKIQENQEAERLKAQNFSKDNNSLLQGTLNELSELKKSFEESSEKSQKIINELSETQSKNQINSQRQIVLLREIPILEKQRDVLDSKSKKLTKDRRLYSIVSTMGWIISGLVFAFLIFLLSRADWKSILESPEKFVEFATTFFQNGVFPFLLLLSGLSWRYSVHSEKAASDSIVVQSQHTLLVQQIEQMRIEERNL